MLPSRENYLHVPCIASIIAILGERDIARHTYYY